MKQGESFITVKLNLVISPNLLTQKWRRKYILVAVDKWDNCRVFMDKQRWCWFASSFYIPVFHENSCLGVVNCFCEGFFIVLLRQSKRKQFTLMLALTFSSARCLRRQPDYLQVLILVCCLPTIIKTRQTPKHIQAREA